MQIAKICGLSINEKPAENLRTPPRDGLSRMDCNTSIDRARR
jgi:hypothetical protein